MDAGSCKHPPEGSSAGDATRSPVGRRCSPSAHTGGVMAAGAAPTAAVSGVGGGAPAAAAREGSVAGTTLLRPRARDAGTSPAVVSGLLAAAALAASASAAALAEASWYHSLGGRMRIATSSPSTARFWVLRPCFVARQAGDTAGGAAVDKRRNGARQARSGRGLTGSKERGAGMARAARVSAATC